MRYQKVKKILIFYCLFVGIIAIYGGITMLIDPTGKLLHMEELLPYFQVLPFSSILFKNYIFSGISLLIVSGISNLTASYLLIKNKKIAYEKANKLGATIIEIKAKEKTKNTKEFWWCGRYGMHKWRMPIEDINIDLKSYKTVIIVSPIWVFSICAPIREFCYKYSKDLNNVEYIFTHYMSSNFNSVANEVDKILNKRRKKFISICIRMGKVKKYKILN